MPAMIMARSMDQISRSTMEACQWNPQEQLILEANEDLLWSGSFILKKVTLGLLWRRSASCARCRGAVECGADARHAAEGRLNGYHAGAGQLRGQAGGSHCRYCQVRGRLRRAVIRLGIT